VADLVTIVGPLAAGKGTLAERLCALLSERGSTSALVDVDDVAAMVRRQAGGAAWLWPAAHEVHGKTVAGWLATAVDVVVAVGNIYDAVERGALDAPLPAGARVLRVVLDAPITVTWERAKDDPERGLSRDREFHERAHARFRALLPQMPADLRLDATRPADELAAQVLQALDNPPAPASRSRSPAG
jgi:hypothetical protein